MHITVPVGPGPLRGLSEDGVAAFRGIPYAQPPVGDLRWRAPEPVHRWDGTLDALAYGAACPQPSLGGISLLRDGSEMSEDCLYLNVWASADVVGSGARLPVLFWIHGGAYQFGSGDLGERGNLFGDEFVLVSLNYRIGRFGQFAHPALTAEDPATSSNYGLLDILEGLRWVRANIAAFGGDPGNVTIFGISSGAGMVNLLMVSALADGLFAKAISESANGFHPFPDREWMERQGEAWALSVGAAEADGAGLRALPSDVVAQMALDPTHAPMPMVDGISVPVRPHVGFANGMQQKVPYLVGATSLEGTLMQVFPIPLEKVLAWLGGDADRVQTLYDPTGDRDSTDVTVDIYGDAGFVAPSRWLARGMDAVGCPTYLYYFDYVPEQLRGQLRGAPHGGEAPFLFRSWDLMPTMNPYAPTEADRAVGEVMQAYWRNFAQTGDPNGTSRPAWPRFDPTSELALTFGPEGPLAGPHPTAGRLDLVEAPAAKDGPPIG